MYEGFTPLSREQQNQYLIDNNKLFNELVEGMRYGMTHNLWKDPVKNEIINLPEGSIVDVRFYTNTDETALYENPLERRYLPAHIVQLGCRPVSTDEAKRIYDKIRTRIYQRKNRLSMNSSLNLTWNDEWSKKEERINKGDKTILDILDKPQKKRVWGGSNVGYVEKVEGPGGLFGISEDDTNSDDMDDLKKARSGKKE